MVTAIVLRLRFSALQPGDTPTGTRRGGVFTGADFVEVPAENFVVEMNGWITFWPLGRVENRNAFVFCKKVAQSGSEQAWLWALPSDPEVDRAALRDVYDALRALWPARVWSLAELRDDTRPVATAIKAAWVDERPRRVRQSGTGPDGEPAYVDDGPDPGAEPIAIYRGIGSVRVVDSRSRKEAEP